MTRHAATTDPGWDAFRSWYPRRQKWPDAEKAWGQLKKAGKLPALVILKVAIKCQQAPGGCLEKKYSNGRDLRPLPASWLRGERWHDEFEPAMRDTAAAAMGMPEAERRDPGEINQSELEAARDDFFKRSREWQRARKEKP